MSRRNTGNRNKNRKNYKGKRSASGKSNREARHEAKHNYSKDELIRLNKYIAHAGFCSRRDADDFIAKGKVKVNDEVVTELGTKVRRTDKVEVDGQYLSLESFIYILLNKPKDTITTTDDERDRTTVMDKIQDATGKRVYPVGRLDRDTMGLLLLTNDGDLAHRLMHPSYKVRKTYELQTMPALTDADLKKFEKGVKLEDGPAKAYNIQRMPGDASIIGMSIFEGRNRQIRRMAEAVGANVNRLKRIGYAGLTLKGVRMGRWRYLRQNEVNALRKLVELDTLDFNKN